GFDFEVTTPETKKQKEKSAVTLAKGDTRTGVVLTVPAHDGVIRGVVLGGDKQPVADTWVTAKRVPDKLPPPPPGKAKDADDGKASDDANEWRNDSTWWPASEPVLTGADGKFTIGKLRDGEYLVVADGPRGSSRAEKRAKPGDSITIELAPLGTLSGKVTANGAPVVGYTITCKGPAGEVDRSSAAADGAYALEHLAPGAYSCTAEAPSGTATGKVDVAASATTLDLALVPFASLTGTVVSMFDKSPVAGVFVIAGSNGDQSAMMDILAGTAPKTDATGRFNLTKVKPGAGAAMVMDNSGFKPLATKPYTATSGLTDLGAIEIVPPRQGDAGTFGMVTEWEQNVLTITQVKPDGPAAKAGLAAGDVIASLAGRAIKDLGGAQVQQYLSSGSIGIGTMVQLGIERGGQKLNVAVASVKW
ncbi:MAG: carboxypeptidase regulatory-like domain-containing protein, partial [Kofleriaceae bacterium]